MLMQSIKLLANINFALDRAYNASRVTNCTLSCHLTLFYSHFTDSMQVTPPSLLTAEIALAPTNTAQLTINLAIALCLMLVIVEHILVLLHSTHVSIIIITQFASA